MRHYLTSLVRLRAASRLLPPDLRERSVLAAQRVTLHLDAREDLLLVADAWALPLATLAARRGARAQSAARSSLEMRAGNQDGRIPPQ